MGRRWKIELKQFISNPIQALNHGFDEIVIITPNCRVVIKSTII